MTAQRLRSLLASLIALVGLVGPLYSADPPDRKDALFQVGQADGSRLEIVEGVPVATLEGTPDEIGRAYASLAHKPITLAWERYIKPAAGFTGGMDKLQEASMRLESHVPDRYRQEMRALAKTMKIGYNDLLACNAFSDIYRIGGCSTFAVAGDVSADGVPYLARNLDFFGLGVLNRTSMVIVFRPKGYKAFASVTWPGLSGVLSGMNRDGLCCAVMEVREGPVTTNGMPSTFLFRRVMEEAGDVEEALEILENTPRIAGNNLMLLDRNGHAAVAELGPDRFEVRRSKKGILFSTNNFHAGKKSAPRCRRFARFTAYTVERKQPVTIADLKMLLNDVNQGLITIQSMIFDPVNQRVHLSAGQMPSSKGDYKQLDLAKLLAEATTAPDEEN